MTFTDDEVRDAWIDHGRNGEISPQVVRALMNRAVELVAALGGTMTAAELAQLREFYRTAEGLAIDPLWAHITAQGATVATLQEKVAYLAAGEWVGAAIICKAREDLEFSVLVAKLALDRAEKAEQANSRLADALTSSAADAAGLRCEVDRLKAALAAEWAARERCCVERNAARENVARLRAANAECHRGIEEMRNASAELTRERDALRAEVESLKGYGAGE